MTGIEFEKLICEALKRKGFWALRIPKNEYGAQPFDVLAIKGDVVYAVDCKVCGRKSFPLSRIEPNQFSAMDVMQEKTNAKIGFAIYHGGGIYFISYIEVANEQSQSIVLDDAHLWGLLN